MNIKDLISKVDMRDLCCDNDVVLEFYFKGVIPVWAMPPHVMFENSMMKAVCKKLPMFGLLYDMMPRYW